MSRIKNENKESEGLKEIELEKAEEPAQDVIPLSITPPEPIKEPTRIYLGPNLPGGRLLQSTVFRGGIPAYLQPLLTELPEVSELIVPVDDMAGIQGRIVQTGTAEYVAYQTLLKGEQNNGI